MPVSKLDKLEARNQYLQEQLTATERKLKNRRQKDRLYETIMDDIHNIVVPLDALPPVKQQTKKGIDEEDLVLHISDVHGDEVITRDSSQGLECYNFTECVVRAENLVENVLKIKNEKLSGYKFPRLWLLWYGDTTSGEIHDLVSNSEFKNQFKNCFALSNLFALVIRDLSVHFNEIKIICVPGNHGRTTPKKNFNDPHDSWDYMIYESTRLLCRAIDNVEFKIPKSYTAIININGHNFFIEHGDDIKAWNGIPYYGIERKSRRIMSLHASQKLFIDYFVNGHFHSATNIPNLGRSETLVNGAWYAANAYSLSMGYHNEPAQWLHGVSKSRGISFRYKVWLRDKTKRMPGRYKSVTELYSK